MGFWILRQVGALAIGAMNFSIRILDFDRLIAGGKNLKLRI